MEDSIPRTACKKVLGQEGSLASSEEMKKWLWGQEWSLVLEHVDEEARLCGPGRGVWTSSYIRSEPLEGFTPKRVTLWHTGWSVGDGLGWGWGAGC